MQGLLWLQVLFHSYIMYYSYEKEKSFEKTNCVCFYFFHTYISYPAWIYEQTVSATLKHFIWDKIVSQPVPNHLNTFNIYLHIQTYTQNSVGFNCSSTLLRTLFYRTTEGLRDLKDHLVVTLLPWAGILSLDQEEEFNCF